MKKVVAVLIALIMCISISACGGGKKALTVTYSDGSTAAMSAKEIIKIKDTDGRTWEKIKQGSISGTGKITDISAGYGTFSNVTTSSVSQGVTFKFNYVELTLDDNIKVLVRQETCGDLYVGDTVRFEGTVAEGHHSVYLYVKCADTEKENTKQFVFRED